MERHFSIKKLSKLATLPSYVSSPIGIIWAVSVSETRGAFTSRNVATATLQLKNKCNVIKRSICILFYLARLALIPPHVLHRHSTDATRSVATAVAITSGGFAVPYGDLATKGYRCVNTNGPYACRSKDDLRQMVKHRTDETEVQMIEQLRAYYLIEGAVVQVLQADAAAGMSRIHSSEIGPDVWTLTTFLSKHPIRNTDGEVEIPSASLTLHK
jgi:hypothetical protein